MEFADFGVQYFRVGEVYDVSATLGSLLVTAGHAEPLVEIARVAERPDSRAARRNPKL